eukprot:scaffold64062_cov23-Cyclotella_meneghiniana.AAC.1
MLNQGPHRDGISVLHNYRRRIVQCPLGIDCFIIVTVVLSAVHSTNILGRSAVVIHHQRCPSCNIHIFNGGASPTSRQQQ